MKRTKVLLLLTLISSVAHGGAFNFMGYGAGSMAMGNSTVALPIDGFSQSYNPALMSEQGASNFSIAVEGAFASFTSINNVLISTPSLGASSNTIGNVSTATKDTFNFVLGYQTALNPHAERPIHLGVNVITPILRIFEIDTPDMYVPQYSMYMSDTQRLIPSITLARKVSDKLAVGVGVNLFMVQGTTSSSGLIAGGESTADLGTEIKTGIAPMLGILYDVDPSLKIGLNYRGNQNYQSQLNVNNTLSLISPSNLSFIGNSSVAYDPDMILLGGSYVSGQETYTLQANYEHWNSYNGGAILLTFETFTGSFSQYVPPALFHDIISLHGGFEHRYDSSQLRVGYSFVPTPVPDESGETNILDSDKHEVYVGYGWKWERNSLLDGKLSVDIVGFADYLVPKKITKVSPNFIGAPGYSIGGTIFGYGVSASREF